MNRIEKKLNGLQNQNKKALITYITAGLPNIGKFEEIIKIQAEAGSDIIEIGIPFSDPIADGPVIQEASYKSIQNGMNLKKTFEIVKKIRESVEVPIVFMLYYNTILYYGIENFIKKCIECGIDGIIVPDLPFEETFEINEFIDKYENSPYLIQLVSPVSKDRIPMIVNDAKGFVYCVSSMGVTGGQQADFHNEIKNCLETVRSLSKVPVMMGFGIRTANDVKAYIDTIHGCIVASHLIDIMEKSNYDFATIKEYITTFKADLNK